MVSKSLPKIIGAQIMKNAHTRKTISQEPVVLEEQLALQDCDEVAEGWVEKLRECSRQEVQ